ncbi:hypothetical protein BS47DRAFT_515804 [Hydnum rufescens UP504]|uniref:Glutamine amidotransferase type-2 domain-containing protein n=1 Tax=Hydnum rufescens UP504 TaxID=1448309 RepID=A0A9P6DPG8_9AGAM|nr:hypothetical protein BS47DRAFT_515804 [Hydnum rufescens UP504]
MCGVVVSISIPRTDDLNLGALHQLNALRGPTAASTAPRIHLTRIHAGPDSQRLISRVVSSSSTSDIQLSLFSSVLHLRGDHIVVQPHINSKGDILCWNGEVFRGLLIEPDENDGSRLFSLLSGSTSVDVPHIMSRLEGPYAFVFYQHSSKTLFYGRDPLGRRSLLMRTPDSVNPTFILASASLGYPTSPSNHFEEISPNYIYQIRLGRVTSLNKFPEFNIAQCIDKLNRNVPYSPDAFSAQHVLNPDIPSVDFPIPTKLSEDTRDAVEEFTRRLDKSVALRVQNIPSPTIPNTARLAVLFSGGIDCAVISFLAHKYVPLNEPIDLINVGFENPRKMKAKAHAKGDVLNKSPSTPNSSAGKLLPLVKEAIMTPNEQNIPQPYDQTNTYMTPDRETGLEQLDELQRMCPERLWNFVKVDVSYEESSAARPTVENLMFPSNTVMDLSLALALYFASRGKGTLHNTSLSHPDTRPTSSVTTKYVGKSKFYSSPARVLLSGLGSDELLGGYSRHRVAFSKGGWLSLVNELQLDLDRLPSRNLGRDDRIISSNGKESRYPYLDLSLVSYLARLPVHVKLDPRMKEDGVGDKRLLREAALKMGLHGASRRKKRAMQFGSRSARMTGGAEERRGDLELNRS